MGIARLERPRKEALAFPIGIRLYIGTTTNRALCLGLARMATATNRQWVKVGAGVS